MDFGGRELGVGSRKNNESFIFIFIFFFFFFFLIYFLAITVNGNGGHVCRDYSYSGLYKNATFTCTKRVMMMC
jgi:hypothetical protein